MTTLPLAEARANLSRLVESAVATHERFEITRNGTRVAVLASAEDFDALLETLDILSDADEVAAVRASLDALERGPADARGGREGRRGASPSRRGEHSVTAPREPERPRFAVEFSPAARRALEYELPEAVAVAALEFIQGPLRNNPFRVGKALREPMAPLYSARRGEYRIIYRILGHRLIIQIVSVRHRRDAYRP